MATCQDFSKEKSVSVSPEPYKEPDGMTTIDLNSGDYSELKSDPKKEKSEKKLKHIKCILWLILFIFLAILALIITSLLNRAHNITKPKYVTHLYDVQTEKYHRRVATTTENFRKEILYSNFIKDNEENFELCKTTRTFDNCCKVFIESEYEDLAELCTVNEIINLIVEYESNARLKRQTYDHPGNVFLDPLKQVASDIKGVAPEILDAVKNIMASHSYEEYEYDADYNDYGEDISHLADYYEEIQPHEEGYHNLHAENIQYSPNHETTPLHSNLGYQVPQVPHHDVIIRPQIAPTTNYGYQSKIQDIVPTIYQPPPHYQNVMAEKTPQDLNQPPPIAYQNQYGKNQNYPTGSQMHPENLQSISQYHPSPNYQNLLPEQIQTNPNQNSQGIYRPPSNDYQSQYGNKQNVVPVPNKDHNHYYNYQNIIPGNAQKSPEAFYQGPTNFYQSNPQVPPDIVQQINQMEIEEGLASTTTSTVCLNGSCDLKPNDEAIKNDLNDTDIKVLNKAPPEDDNGERTTQVFELNLLRGDNNTSETAAINIATRLRGSEQQQQQPTDEFRSKVKAFPSEDVQISQQIQTSSQPCFYPYPYPQMMYQPMFQPPQLKTGAINDGSQMLRIIPMNQQPRTNQNMYVLNPPMYYNFPFQQNYFPQQNYPQNYPQHYNSYGGGGGGVGGGGALQASGPGGQYYMCNPIPPPASNVAAVSGVEIRREAFNLQDLMENYTARHRPPGNKTRDSGIICPMGKVGCSDNTKCIKSHRLCDNEINCDDASDEAFCTCKERVGSLRHCDGYCDCFDCEDEEGCFGCKEDEFSCDDWSRFRKSTCIPTDQRCDNVRQCEITGRDEEDCSVLSDRIGDLPTHKISNAVGFLHRNYKGKWYPTCFGTDMWALEVCNLEAGPSTIAPKSHMTLTTDKYDGAFINILPNNEVGLVNTCVQDRAAFVECPPLYCGIRMVIKNMYRPHEVDTSIEDDLNDIDRSILREKLVFDNATLGASRVVGGKASQPASWPWLVTIYKNGVFHCGGILINEMWVVTAAHCVDRYWQYYYEIQAGVLRRFSYSPMEQTRWGVQVIPHESYDKVNLRNDIALFRLSAPLRYNRYIRPICLPSEATAGRDFLHGPTAGTMCTTVGWGATLEHGADPDHMREVEIPILRHCRHKEDADIDEICAGYNEGGKDACQGDSGGPLMCRNPNSPSQWYLAGIVSHGEGCARPDEPGVYTRVSRFVGWIAENMKQSKFSPRVPLQKCPGYICKGTKKCLPKKRHCDRIVDCLLADDEENCEAAFHNMFKHSRKNYYAILGQSLNSTNNVNEANSTVNQIESTSVPSLIESDQTNTTVEHFFKCKIMLQVIPANLKCNKLIDCEDGSDEVDCLCVDYVRNINPGAVCDGVTDCLDLSDETGCGKCTESEYFCRRNNKCIPMSSRCDRIPDCDKKEDEWDCAALTDGRWLRLDGDLRPGLSPSGIIAMNRGGVWRPWCGDAAAAGGDDEGPRVATSACNMLGFDEYDSFHKYHVEDRPLEVTFGGFNGTGSGGDGGGGGHATCDAIYVRCSNVMLDTSLHSARRSNDTFDVELYTSPWNAAIYDSGVYECMGAILDARWIVTSVNCFKGITMLENKNVAVLVGKGKANLRVAGPHEETLRIVESVYIGADIVLLRTERNITFSRYCRPAHFNIRRDKLRQEQCVATGLEEGKASFVFLSPIKHCRSGVRCFESKKVDHCKDVSPWSGTIVCDSGNGWYPTAVFFEENGRCGLGMINNYTNLISYKNKILKTMSESKGYIQPPPCDGFLCKLGNCISKNKTCDGIPDCRNSEDESSDLCYEREQQCHLTDNCSCPRSHLKCSNNKCVPKSAFCDRNNDCGDFGDEPDVCSCAAYLAVSSPEKLCDGVLHCKDRSDEEPHMCGCRVQDFSCPKSKLCVPRKMVCDGFPDCPDGEDEKECISLKLETGDRSNVGEVMTQTAGVWHSGCHAMNYTTAQLEEICAELGFTGGSASQLPPPRDLKDVTSVRPVFDDFDVVWFRRGKDNRFKLQMRTGNRPYVTLEPHRKCFRLFIACL